MIEFISYEDADGSPDCELWFTKEDKPRLIKALERGLNTLSPPDMELIKLLEDMKK